MQHPILFMFKSKQFIVSRRSRDIIITRNIGFLDLTSSPPWMTWHLTCTRIQKSRKLSANWMPRNRRQSSVSFSVKHAFKLATVETAYYDALGI